MGNSCDQLWASDLPDLPSGWQWLVLEKRPSIGKIGSYYEYYLDVDSGHIQIHYNNTNPIIQLSVLDALRTVAERYR